MTTWRGVLSGIVIGAALVTVPSSPATADPVLDRVEALVAAVPSGTPLRVVETTVSPSGAPRFTTTAAASRSDARRLLQSLLQSGRSASMAQPVRATASNDPLRSRQWALTRLRAESIWPRTTAATTSRTRRITVAVVDTGVATDHPDLKRNLVTGRDVVSPGTAPYDENGHGTHVAGIVAAVANNKVGVAGLAPGAAIMPVRVLDRTGSGTTDDVARGVTWAADRGARVINLSLSSSGSDRALQTAVAYAQRRGAVVVAAAGNDGGSLQCGLLGCPKQYPAAYSGVVGVGSIDQNRSRSSFSSTGSWVDVAAPGGGIISTMARSNRLGCGTSGYCTISGTSMAAPYVAAAAALARSNHSWSAATTASRVMSTATDLGARGRDDTYGHGLVDPLALVTAR